MFVVVKQVCRFGPGGWEIGLEKQEALVGVGWGRLRERFAVGV